jgi:tetratricopeptide (TPR) repeat protein
LFDPVGFWSEPARRSYLVAGSFVRFLIDRHGWELFRRAYAEGSLDGYPGQAAGPIREWERFLDGLMVEPPQMDSARVLFGQSSIFARPCAHEMARLEARGRESLQRNRPREALETARRMLEHLPDDPDGRLLELDALAADPAADEAYPLANRLLERDDWPPAARLGLLERLGRLEVERGELERACPRFRQVLEAQAGDALVRLNLARLDAIACGEAGLRVLEFLQGKAGAASGIVALVEAERLAPEWGLPAYLLGRQLAQNRDCRRAMPYLERAGERGLPHPVFSVETLKLMLVCRYEEGDRQGAAEVAAVLAQYPLDSAGRAYARDWLERLAFEAGLTCGE